MALARLAQRPLPDSRTSAEREVDGIVRPLMVGPRKCQSSPPAHAAPLSEFERSNSRSKSEFEARIVAAGLGEDTVRQLAAFFDTKRSTLFERMSPRRKDLAPLPAWFKKLDDYIEFNRLLAVFARTA